MAFSRMRRKYRLFARQTMLRRPAELIFSCRRFISCFDSYLRKMIVNSHQYLILFNISLPKAVFL